MANSFQFASKIKLLGDSHDRTGVVVATYFVWSGHASLEAKQKFQEVFLPPVRGRYSHRPLIETEWELLEQYRDWLTENV